MAQPSPEVRAERRRLRALRAALPPRARAAAERAIALGLRRSRLVRPGRHVAVYLAIGGEAGLAPVIRYAQQVGAHLYVPQVLHPRRRRMAFVPLPEAARFRPNVYGIAEPIARAGTRSPVARLDVILLPLVGFDRAGHRLGMGAGYYDRALVRRRDPGRRWRRPKLVGIAFACQELPRIEPSPWDVTLDCVVTERELIACAPGHPSERETP